MLVCGRALRWHCTCSFMRQIIVIADPSPLGLPVWRVLQMRVQVRPCVLASARCVWFLVKMSVAVSMSMNQSSNFEESCPSNVGIPCNRVMVMFACIVIYMASSLGWGFGCSQSATVRCCSSSASFSNSFLCVGGWLKGCKGKFGPKDTGIDLVTQPSGS